MTDDLPVQPQSKVGRFEFVARHCNHQNRTIVAAPKRAAQTNPCGNETAAHSAEAFEGVPATIDELALVGGYHLLRVAPSVEDGLHLGGPSALRVQRATEQPRIRW